MKNTQTKKTNIQKNHIQKKSQRKQTNNFYKSGKDHHMMNVYGKEDKMDVLIHLKKYTQEE